MKVPSSFTIYNLGKNMKCVSNKCGSTSMTKISLYFPQEIMKGIIIRFMAYLLLEVSLGILKLFSVKKEKILTLTFDLCQFNSFLSFLSFFFKIDEQVQTCSSVLFVLYEG